MKIVLIIPASMMISGSTSGVNRQVNSYYHCLLKVGYSVSFLYHYEGVEGYDCAIIFQHNLEIVSLINRIKIKNKNIKIFFAPIYDPDKKTSFFLKCIYRIPFEFFKLNVSPRSMRIGFDNVNRIICRSFWEYSAIKASGTKTPISIIPLALPIEIDNHLEGNKKDIDYLFVGLIDDPRKNVERLVKAVNNVGGHLHLIGKVDKKFIEHLETFISNSNTKITYHGIIPDERLIEFYARTKVLCLPSLFEGVGQVAMEAYSFGARIVITSIGGTKDYFKKNTFFVKNPLSINDISKNLTEALKSSDSTCKTNKEFIGEHSEANIGKKLSEVIN